MFTRVFAVCFSIMVLNGLCGGSTPVFAQDNGGFSLGSKNGPNYKDWGFSTFDFSGAQLGRLEAILTRRAEHAIANCNLADFQEAIRKLGNLQRIADDWIHAVEESIKTEKSRMQLINEKDVLQRAQFKKQELMSLIASLQARFDLKCVQKIEKKKKLPPKSHKRVKQSRLSTETDHPLHSRATGGLSTETLIGIGVEIGLGGFGRHGGYRGGDSLGKAPKMAPRSLPRG